MTAAPTLRWIPAGPLATLAPGSARAVTDGADRVAVFRQADGSLAAIDDRCPHEGYPLSKGFVNQGVVTCRWHAFRFRLDTGHCLVGDEHARTFEVRVVDGTIEVGVAAPDHLAARRRAEASLVRGLERRRMGQVARDVVRLVDSGASARDVMRHAILFDAERAPYGTTHVPALACDLLPRLDPIAARLGEDGRLAALLQPLDLCADPLARMPPRDRPAPEDPGPDPASALATLRARVESEDATGAEALVRGAVLIRHVPLATLAAWFGVLVDDHLLDIGHAAIYVTKLFPWLEGESPDVVERVLGAFVVGIAHGTREELLPEWSSILRTIEQPGEDEPAVDPAASHSALIRALLDGPRDAVVPALRRALASTSRAHVVDTLAIAASLRLLRFDPAIERDPTVQDTWLDTTHTLTTAIALGSPLLDDSPRLLMLVAAFIYMRRGHDAPSDLRPFDETSLVARAELAGDPLELVAHALEVRDPDAIVAPAVALATTEPASLVALLEDWCLTRGAARAIFAAHHLKVLIAAESQHRRLCETAPRWAHVPLVAAARFIAAPLHERPLMRLAHEALRFVRDSRVPRRLA